MSLVVVGSVAYDAIETPYGRRERTLGGACTYISLAASYFTPVSIVGIVGDDFASEDTALLASRNIDLEGLERVPGKTFFWSGVYSEDMNDRTTLRHGPERLRGLRSEDPSVVPREAVPVPGQYPARVATRRPRADERRPPGRRRHDELLDRRLSGRAARHDPRVGLPAHQRQRSTPALRRAEPEEGRRERSSTWVRSP